MGAKETSPMEPRSKKTRSKNYLDVRARSNGRLVTPFPFTSFSHILAKRKVPYPSCSPPSHKEAFGTRRALSY